MPENTMKVDRSTRWGNPYVAGEDFDTVEECIDHFEHDINKAQVFRPDDYEAWIAPLRGKSLACWCPLPPPGEPDHCHAAILLEIANDPLFDVAPMRQEKAAGITLSDPESDAPKPGETA